MKASSIRRLSNSWLFGRQLRVYAQNLDMITSPATVHLTGNTALPRQLASHLERFIRWPDVVYSMPAVLISAPTLRLLTLLQPICNGFEASFSRDSPVHKVTVAPVHHHISFLLYPDDQPAAPPMPTNEEMAEPFIDLENARPRLSADHIRRSLINFPDAAACDAAIEQAMVTLN